MSDKAGCRLRQVSDKAGYTVLFKTTKYICPTHSDLLFYFTPHFDYSHRKKRPIPFQISSRMLSRPSEKALRANRVNRMVGLLYTMYIVLITHSLPPIDYLYTCTTVERGKPLPMFISLCLLY